jgi:hypothetical protein
MRFVGKRERQIPCSPPQERIFARNQLLSDPAPMKHLLLAALLLATSALADSPDAILKDYRTRAAQAVERLNQSLEKAATPLITKLVASGDTAGADQLTKELRAKIAGEAVAAPQASAEPLFSLYDEAHAKALAPVQKASIARIDSMLKTAGGPKLEIVTELSKVREEIEAGMPSPAALSMAELRSHLKRNKISKTWVYYFDAEFTKKYGMLSLNEDGTLVLNSGGAWKGTWMPTSDPMVLALEIKDGEKPSEQAEMVIKGKEATMKRAVGMRYLKAD